MTKQFVPRDKMPPQNKILSDLIRRGGAKSCEIIELFGGANVTHSYSIVMRYAPSESDTRKKVRVLEDKYTLKLQEYIHNMCKERNMMKIQIDNVVSAIATSKIKKLKSKGK